MKTLAYTRGMVLRDAAGDDADDGLLRFVGATEGEKPDGIALKMAGARLDRYRANPVFGYGHRYGGRDSLPIGRSEETVVDGSRLLFDIAFDRDDAFAAEVERKYRAGFLNAVSIGFSVLEWEDPQNQDYWRGGVAVDWELYELSAVPLPMDPNAVVESGRAGGGLAVETELLDAVRGLLNRLDGQSIGALRQLIDRAAGDHRTEPDPAELSAADAIAMRRRRLQLLGT